jgi:hypothetical protein
MLLILFFLNLRHKNDKTGTLIFLKFNKRLQFNMEVCFENRPFVKYFLTGTGDENMFLVVWDNGKF